MLSCQCVALKRNCRCHGAWNLQRHAAVREVSVEMHKVPCHKLSHRINNKVIEGKIVFLTLATLFFFGKWPWQVGKVVQENMPPSRFVQLRRGRDVSACTLKCLEMIQNVAWFLHCAKVVSSVS